jgi:5-methylcytosine-specific restriction endonuclease McrA
MLPLPEPDSLELSSLGLGTAPLVVYRVLWENRHRPLTMIQIRLLAAPVLESLGLKSNPEQLARRRRDLNRFFVFEKTRRDRETEYRLVGKKPGVEPTIGINQRVRAEVLLHGRCNMCGRTVAEDHIKLQVDHRLPKELGGTDQIGNLQALCEDCNRGKKAYFAEFAHLADQIAGAAQHQEVHVRIGELLKAFNSGWVRSDALEMVAHVGAYQEDWQKRLRELRTIGWKIESRRTKAEGRVWSYYRVTQFNEWPKGPVLKAIKAAEARRKATRRATKA